MGVKELKAHWQLPSDPSLKSIVNLVRKASACLMVSSHLWTEVFLCSPFPTLWKVSLQAPFRETVMKVGRLDWGMDRMMELIPSALVKEEWFHHLSLLHHQPSYVTILLQRSHDPGNDLYWGPKGLQKWRGMWGNSIFCAGRAGCCPLSFRDTYLHLTVSELVSDMSLSPMHNSAQEYTISGFTFFTPGFCNSFHVQVKLFKYI